MGPYGEIPEWVVEGTTEEDVRNMLRRAKAAGHIMVVPPKMFKHPFVQQMCAEFPGVIHESKPLPLTKDLP